MNDLSEIKINIPGKAGRILETLKENGYEAYIVGGCVRDSILGRTPGDWDITTSALPINVKSLFNNTVDTGIEHGTVMVVIGGEGFEVTTYRVDGKYTDGRHPDKVEFTPSLEEDLKRRDFTINAFAYAPETGLIDMFDGLSDLGNKIIRCVGDPDKRFSEDALRIMRAVRFAAQLSFEIEPETYAAIHRHAFALEKVSAERIRVEFEKTLMSANPEYVNLFAALGLSEYIIKGNAEGITKDVHGLCFDRESEALYKAIDAVLKDREARGLFSADVYAETRINDRRYLRMAAFFKNLDFSCCQLVIRKMTYDNKTRAAVSKILKYKDEDIILDRKKIKWAMYEMGTEIFDLVMTYKEAVLKVDSGLGSGSLSRVQDIKADSRLGSGSLSRVQDVVEIAEDIRNKGEPYNISMLAVTGRDLIMAGVPVGDIIGKTMDKMLEAVIEYPELNTKERLLGLV